MAAFKLALVACVILFLAKPSQSTVATKTTTTAHATTSTTGSTTNTTTAHATTSTTGSTTNTTSTATKNSTTAATAGTNSTASANGARKGMTGPEKVIDVTNYGASPGGSFDANSKAFLAAWAEACKTPGLVALVIPSGTYQVGVVGFRGPCTNNMSPRVQIDGTLTAPPSANGVVGASWIEFNQLHDLVVEGSGLIDGKGAEAWKVTNCRHTRICKNPPFSLRLTKVQGARLQNLKFKDSKGKNIAVHHSENVTVTDLTITAPGDSPNTDGIHISSSTTVNITGLTIGVGDDCISIGPGTKDLSISNVVCGPGHGISVGSLGKFANEEDVTGVKVKNCTISGTTNGVRIKSWPGSPPSKALNISFEDIKLENVSNPIIIDQAYCPSKPCTTQPSKVMIKDVVFRNIQGTSNTEKAVTLACSAASPCQGVKLEEINLKPVPGLLPSITVECTNAVGAAAGKQVPGQCL